MFSQGRMTKLRRLCKTSGSSPSNWDCLLQGQRGYDLTAEHTHCLSPARTRSIDAAVAPTSYARLFPDLPAFAADEAFLYALGRAGGLCDCGDGEDDAASLGTVAAGWPFFGQFVAHDI